MAVAFYTGSFTFFPPKPILSKLSKNIAKANETISIIGENLDYVNSVFLNEIPCEFRPNTINDLFITIPSNPDTGFIEITDKIFYPLRTLDCEFATGSQAEYLINIKNSGKNIILNNVYQDQAYVKDSIYLSTIRNTGLNSLVLELGKNLYRNESVKYDSIIYTGEIINDSFQIYQTGISANNFQYFIPLKKNLNEPYITLITDINTGSGIYSSFTTGHLSSGFYLNFTDYLNENLKLNIGVYTTGKYNFTDGYHFANVFDTKDGGNYFGVQYPGGVQLDSGVQIFTNLQIDTGYYKSAGVYGTLHNTGAYKTIVDFYSGDKVVRNQIANSNNRINYNLGSFPTKFTASFDYKAGGGNGADGGYFYFFSDMPNIENGPNGRYSNSMNTAGYRVHFDEFGSNEQLAISWRGYTTLGNGELLKTVGKSNINILGFNFADQKWRKIKIIFNEGIFNIYVDNILRLSHTDVNYNKRNLTNYNFGLGGYVGAFNNFHYFKNLEITDINNNIVVRDIVNTAQMGDVKLNDQFYLSKIYNVTSTGFYFGLSKDLVAGDLLKLNYLIVKNDGNYMQSITKRFASNESFLPDNKLEFFPVPEVRNINPAFASSGTQIELTGIGLKSITGLKIYTYPEFDDIEYIFGTGIVYTPTPTPAPVRSPVIRRRIVIPVPITTTTTTTTTTRQVFQSADNNFRIPASIDTVNGGAPDNTNICLNQVITNKSDTSNFMIMKLDPWSYTGKSIFVRGKDIQQKFYENHLFTFDKIVTNLDFQTFNTGFEIGKKSYGILLPENFNPQGGLGTSYSPFYSIIYTGTDLDYFSYISGKSNTGFFINFNKQLTYPVSGHFLIVNNFSQGINFDNTKYFASGIKIPTGSNLTGISFQNNYLFKPLLLTSLEYSASTGITSGYIYNISNYQNNKFDFFSPYNTTGDTLLLNYCTVMNTGMNLNTFVFDGKQSFYKKSYLFSGATGMFLDEININNFEIINKNRLIFNFPYSEYTIKESPINVLYRYNSGNFSQGTLTERPEITGIEPEFIAAGEPFKLLGKSFKRSILADGTGYNSTNINLKYIQGSSDNLYLENDNDLKVNAYILDVNTIGGIIPAVENPPGSYSIQVITEKGEIY